VPAGSAIAEEPSTTGTGPVFSGLAAVRDTAGAFAVVALEAGVAARAAATRRRLPADSSNTTVTPESTRVRRSFLACAGFTSALSTAWATSAEVS
jgi:hypothetical protein